MSRPVCERCKFTVSSLECSRSLPDQNMPKLTQVRVSSCRISVGNTMGLSLVSNNSTECVLRNATHV